VKGTAVACTKLQSCNTKNNKKIKGERRRDKQGEAREMKCPHFPDQVYLSAHFFHNNSCGGKGKADPLGFKPCHIM